MQKNDFFFSTKMEFLSSKGAKLVSKDGTEVSVSTLQGKLVAFYFSVCDVLISHVDTSLFS